MIQDGGLTWPERVWPVGQGCGGEGGGGGCAQKLVICAAEWFDRCVGGVRAGPELGEMD